MSTIETVVRGSQQLEKTLESIGGRGSGLGEKARSLSGVLDATIQRRLQRIVLQRNKVVHEPNAEIGDLSAFQAEVASLVKALRKIAATTARARAPGSPQRKRAARANKKRQTSRAGRTRVRLRVKRRRAWMLVACTIVLLATLAAAVFTLSQA